MNRSDSKKHFARKYARAFLRIYNDVAQEELFGALERLTTSYEQHRLAFHTLELSSARIDDKCAGLRKVTESLDLPKSLSHLLATMLRQKNLKLLPFLLPILKEEYKKIHHHHDVVVTSAQPLSAQHRTQLEQHVGGALDGVLNFIYKEDQSLIAGVKIQTPTHYWEYSIARTIRMLKHSVRQQEAV